MLEMLEGYKGNAKLLSPLTLAFLGDVVYELLVRETLIQERERPVGKLHELSAGQVRASAQSEVYRLLQEYVTEEELSILKRGRNAAPAHTPKNASPIDYRRATGVEALFGYLYLTGQYGRIQELFTWIRTKEGAYEENASK